MIKRFIFILHVLCENNLRILLNLKNALIECFSVRTAAFNVDSFAIVCQKRVCICRTKSSNFGGGKEVALLYPTTFIQVVLPEASILVEYLL